MRLAAVARQSREPWRLTVCAAVLAFLAVSVATSSFRVYHLFTLLAIPFALFASEAGRRFFVEWGPLLATWIAYDRFRLLQPWLLARVGVEWPYALERAAFGWLAGGEVPPHAARAFIAAQGSSPFWSSVLVEAEWIYVSHLFLYPLLFGVWWWRGRREAPSRRRFLTHVVAFATMNVLGFVGYVLVPAAPPWWVSLHGFAPPTAGLVASAQLAAAIDGDLVRRTIETAPDWFAAMPSLHGGYPVLLAMLAARERRWLGVAFALVYGAAMWAATVALNLHYLVDLVAGGVVAVGAYAVTRQLERRGWIERLGGFK